ncbi:MAG: hypothetical protein RIT28_1826 [Pseudomonadota bacterium]
MLPFLLVLFSPACRHHAPAEEAGGAPAFVGWSPSGERLLTAPPGVLSPSGERWARLSGKSVLWGPLDGQGDHGMIPLERLLGGDTDELPLTLGAWIDEEHLYLHQLDAQLVYAAQTEDVLAEACRVVNVMTEAFTEPKACIQGSFLELHGLQFRDGVAIVESHGEGHPGLDAFRWTPELGQGERVLPELDLYPFGPVVPHFTDAGIALLTPCHLGEERPCQAADGEDRSEEPWRHYVVQDGALSLVREGLPADAQPHPQDTNRYLWAEGEQVCDGDPAGRRRCR